MILKLNKDEERIKMWTKLSWLNQRDFVSMINETQDFMKSTNFEQPYKKNFAIFSSEQQHQNRAKTNV
jgi:hypothetical protein